MFGYGAAEAFAGLVRVVLSALYTHVLLPGEFGHLAVIYVSVTFAVALVPFGLPSAMMVRFVHIEQTGFKQLKDELFSYIFLFFGIAACIFLVAVRLMPKPEWFGPQVVGGIIIWAGASVLWPIPLLSLRYQQRVAACAATMAAQVITMAAAFGIFWLLGPVDLEHIIAAEAMGAVAGLLLAHALDSYLPALRLKVSPRTLAVMGAPFCMLALVHIVVDLSDRYIITFLMGADATGYYAVAARFAIAGSMLSKAFNNTWQPHFYRHAGTGAIQGDALRLVGRRLIALSGIAVGLLVLLLPLLMSAHLGDIQVVAPAFRGAAILLGPLVVQYYFKTVYFVATPAINFHGRTWWQVIVIAGIGLLNVVGNTAAIVFGDENGLYGTLTMVAYVTAASYALAMALGLRKLHRLYPAVSPGPFFVTAATGLAVVPLVGTNWTTRFLLLVGYALVFVVCFRRSLLPQRPSMQSPANIDAEHHDGAVSETSSSAK